MLRQNFFHWAPLLLTVLLTGCDASYPEPGVSEPEAAVSWRVGSEPALVIGEDQLLRSAPLHAIIDAKRLPTGEIVIADALRRLVVVDSTGNVLRIIGREGSGPGEFRAIGWIAPSGGDQIIVYDEALARIQSFGLDGELRASITVEAPGAEIPLPPAVLTMLEDGTYLAASRLILESPAGNAGIVRPNMALMSVTSEGAAGEPFMIIPGSELAVVSGVIATPDFLRRTLVASAGADFLAAEGDNLVTRYDREGRVLATGSAPIIPVPITADYVASSRLSTIEGFTFPPEFPGIDQLIVDETGFVWVSEFETSNAAERRWYVLSDALDVVGYAELPSSLRPTHIGEDFLLGVWTDSLDIQTVREHRLAR